MDAIYHSLRKGDKIMFRRVGDQEWINGLLTSRAGKKGGKWEHSWNVELDDNTTIVVDFKLDGVKCKYPNHSESDIVINDLPILLTSVDRDIENAKELELASWLEKEVYDEVNDENQECVSVRWVITPKIIDGHPSVKARLVAKGFQESENLRTDSPTCSKDSIRLVIATSAIKKWRLHSADIQAAFLQGSKLERTVHLNLLSKLKQTNCGVYKSAFMG